VYWFEFDGRYLLPAKGTAIKMNNLRLDIKNAPSIESHWEDLIVSALSEADKILATVPKIKHKVSTSLTKRIDYRRRSSRSHLWMKSRCLQLSSNSILCLL
jgi:hypothetical protein